MPTLYQNQFESKPHLRADGLCWNLHHDIYCLDSTFLYNQTSLAMATPQIQFYQYRPDSDARHNAVFTPMPQDQQSMYGHMGYPQHGYPAPQYWQQPHYPQPHHYMPQRMMSQSASPPLTLTMPMQRAQMEHLMDQRPPTPCLSACPSTASSPPASSVHHQTPVGPGYFHLPIEHSKEEVIPFMHEFHESTGESFNHSERGVTEC